MQVFINISMAYRKKIESWLEKDCDQIVGFKPRLLESNSTGYLWQLTVDSTEFEIKYSDLGYITLSSLPKQGYITTEVREIYQGNASEQSYRRMIELLTDNLVDHWI
jgi:hypothetical protein